MSWLIDKIRKIFSKRSYPSIKLSMKAIIRWEQLSKKSFYKLNYSSEDDIISLFYTCTLSDQIHISLDEFRNGLTTDSAKKMIYEFEKQTSLVSQFQEIPKKKDEDKNSEPTEPPYIKDIVAKLVMNGLDVYFALNKMELCDLSIFLQAYDQNVKDSLESQRLGIFWMLRPHISDKIKTPKDLYSFSWEGQKEATITQREWEEAERILKLMKRG